MRRIFCATVKWVVCPPNVCHQFCRLFWRSEEISTWQWKKKLKIKNKMLFFCFLQNKKENFGSLGMESELKKNWGTIPGHGVFLSHGQGLFIKWPKIVQTRTRWRDVCLLSVHTRLDFEKVHKKRCFFLLVWFSVEAVWQVPKAWEACDQTCGGGVQIRNVTCSAGIECDESIKPASQQVCNTEVCRNNQYIFFTI